MSASAYGVEGIDWLAIEFEAFLGKGLKRQRVSFR